MVQGKKFAEWSSDEFPALLAIVNSLEPLTDNGSLTLEDTSLFLADLPKFFTKLQEEDKEITNQENAGQCIAEETPNTARETPKSRQEPVKPLTLTTSRLHTLSTLRKTVGNLEAEFTQFKINIEGNFEQLKDKAVQQDHLLKLQKSHVGDLCDDLINSNKLLNDQLQNHAILIAKLKKGKSDSSKETIPTCRRKCSIKGKTNATGVRGQFS